MTHPFRCTSCELPMSGQYVRALGGTFHINCFTCLDCGAPVASKYFPIVSSSGKASPLCERDYFSRLDLLCARCGEAIHGSYINALGKKFHVDHFACSLCLTTFGPSDAYYEHNGNIYCHYHFSVLHASKCAGCHMAILKQYVDITRSGIEEQWHLECYMIHKVWNITLASIILTPKPPDLNLKDAPSNATQSSPPLLTSSPSSSSSTHFSSSSTSDTPKDLPVMSASDSFTLASEQLKRDQILMEELVSRIWSVLSIFEESAASCISNMLLHVSNGLYLEGVREAASFILHIEVLFAGIDLIDQRLAIFMDHMGLVYAKEPKFLCKKVIGFFALLSHTQKTGIKRLEITQELLSLVTSLAHSLKSLIRLSLSGALKLEREYQSPSSISAFLDTLLELSEQEKRIQLLLDTEATSERCQLCQVPIEEACITSLPIVSSTSKIDSFRWHLKCFSCIRCQSLLSSDLRNAIGLQTNETYGPLCQPCFLASNGDLSCDFDRVTSLSQYIFLLRVSLQRLLILFNVNHHATTASTTTTTTSSSPSHSLALLPSTSISTSVLTSSTSSPHPSSSDSDFTVHPSDLHSMDPSLSPSQPPPELAPSFTSDKSKESLSTLWLSELSAFEFYLLRHVVVRHLETLFHWPSEELLPLIDEGKKPSLWNRFVHTLLKKGKPKEEGTFAVPLETLVAKTGVASALGAGPGQILLPAFIDMCITSLRANDLHVEGIFRKNGNIKRLNQVRELFDLDPFAAAQTIRDEPPIQVAALLKKFLRELPEPLLTYRLYHVFVEASHLTDEVKRQQALHYAICLLPKVNRDILEVLLLCLRDVAECACHDDPEKGSKMDLWNLATVMAPNLLIPPPKFQDDPAAAVNVVYCLLVWQSTFWTVPDQLAWVLREEALLGNNGMTGSYTKELLKKVASTLESRRKNDVYVVRDTDHRASKALIEEEP